MVSLSKPATTTKKNLFYFIFSRPRGRRLRPEGEGKGKGKGEGKEGEGRERGGRGEGGELVRAYGPMSARTHLCPHRRMCVSVRTRTVLPQVTSKRMLQCI
jgi:hypothetical protein